MLIIYGALALGGVETFIVRLLESHYVMTGKKAKLLLLESKVPSNQGLLKRASQVSQIYFHFDIFRGKGFIAKRTSLLSVVKRGALSELMCGVENIHTASGHHALLAFRLNRKIGHNVPITVGFYHSLEFAWGKKKLPYFERVNRHFVLNHIPKSNLFLFSESTAVFYKRVADVDLSGAETFRLGVLDDVTPKWCVKTRSKLKVVSVGRLTHFKTYNLWMLKVISRLLSYGIDINYSVYGSGPLMAVMKEECNNLGLTDEAVSFMGDLEYDRFDEVVLDSDIFVGSGTAIIQAASLGVPSIVGIESEKNPVSYGFFHRCAHIDYNINEECFPLMPVEDIIISYRDKSPEEKLALSKRQSDSCKPFVLSLCTDNFIKRGCSHIYKFEYSPVGYVLSYISTLILCKLLGKNFYRMKRTL